MFPLPSAAFITCPLFFKFQKLEVIALLITMIPLAVQGLAHAKLEREAALMIVIAKEIWSVEKIIANCLMQAQLQSWIVVLVKY